MFETLAQLLGLRAPTARPPLSGADSVISPVGTPAPPGPTRSPVAPNPHDRYSALWQAIDQKLADVFVQVVAPHRHYEPEDVFALVRVQAKGTSPGAEEVLATFLNEFKPDSRRRMVLAAVARNCPEGVSTEHFAAFHRDFTDVELQDSDRFNAQLSSIGDQVPYEISLYGEWRRQSSPAPGTQPAPGPAGVDLAVPLLMRLKDGRGTRDVTISRLPWLIGREHARPELAITGKFVSREHGLLDLDDRGQLFYRDISLNGTSVDGKDAKQGSRHPLQDGSELLLGGHGASVGDCPVLQVLSGAGAAQTRTPVRMPPVVADVAAATPVRLPGGAAGAVTAGGATTPVLCKLAVQDASGSRTVAVTALPFEVGRDPGMAGGCRISEANVGVSRIHWVVISLEGPGARIVQGKPGEPAAWGTEVDQVEQPAEFVLPWGSVATLAAAYTKAPPVHIQLLRPGT